MRSCLKPHLDPDGLYVFPNLHLQGSIPASSASCFVSNSVTYVCSDVNTLNSAVKTTFVDSACTSTGSQTLWHLRLGHPSSNVLRLVLNHCKIPISNKNVFEFCTACCVGKSHRLPASLSETVYNKPLELIYRDLWGPVHIPSKNGFHYYITFVDAYSRFTWIYLLKHKSETFTIFQQFKLMNFSLTPKLRVFTQIEEESSDLSLIF